MVLDPSKNGSDPPRNDLKLGTVVDRSKPLTLSAAARSMHLYVCGSTGTGKSKFLESLIRQDVLANARSGCGLLLIDPHGSLCDAVLSWMARHNIDRPVIPIDLSREDAVVSYNVLRRRKANPSVVVGNIIEAITHVWGDTDTNHTPRFARGWGTSSMPSTRSGSLSPTPCMFSPIERTTCEQGERSAPQPPLRESGATMLGTCSRSYPAPVDLERLFHRQAPAPPVSKATLAADPPLSEAAYMVFEKLSRGEKVFAAEVPDDMERFIAIHVGSGMCFIRDDE